MSERIYLDHAATTPLRPEVRLAMEPFLGSRFGNASSLHAEGRDAREALEAARATILGALGAGSRRLVFTSGGTEADDLAVIGTLLAAEPADSRVVASAVEHAAVRSLQPLVERLGGEWVEVDVDSDGRVERGDLQAALADAPTGPNVVSVQAINNETGTVQPIDAVAALARAAGAVVHCDAVQLIGHGTLRIDDEATPDLIALSAHKIGGPHGIGALIVGPGVELQPLLRGGAQEGGVRPGTEPIAAAVGFARAVECAVAECDAGEPERLAALRDRLEDGLRQRIPGLVVNTPSRDRAPHILSVSVPGVSGESLAKLLDELGVAVSTGSACNVGKSRPSPVLRAMGRTDEQIRGSLRYSSGRETTADEIDAAVERTAEAVEQLWRIGGFVPRRG